MHLVMFDIDGTLIESYDFDGECFRKAVADVLGIAVDTNWGSYNYVTDSGILEQIMNEQNILLDRESLALAVKQRFFQYIAHHLSCHAVVPIKGATDFIAQLIGRKDVRVAIATGGWLESALLKLQAAGFNVSAIPIASASDHFNRTEIMRLAQERAAGDVFSSMTYFGDGPWDFKAASELGYNFVLVGDRIKHYQAIADFLDIETALAYIEL